MLELLSLPTVAAIVGAVLLVIGLRMIYEPLAYIVPGGALVSGAVFGVVRAHGKAGR